MLPQNKSSAQQSKLLCAGHFVLWVFVLRVPTEGVIVLLKMVHLDSANKLVGAPILASISWTFVNCVTILD